MAMNNIKKSNAVEKQQAIVHHLFYMCFITLTQGTHIKIDYMDRTAAFFSRLFVVVYYVFIIYGGIFKRQKLCTYFTVIAF